MTPMGVLCGCREVDGAPLAALCAGESSRPVGGGAGGSGGWREAAPGWWHSSRAAGGELDLAGKHQGSGHGGSGWRQPALRGGRAEGGGSGQ